MLTAIIGAVAAAVAVTVGALALGLREVCGVAQKAMDIAQRTGTLNTEDSVDELGAKGLKAEEDGITPENPEFEGDMGKYMNTIEQQDIQEDINRWSPEQKALKALEISSCILADKYGPAAGKVVDAMLHHAGVKDNEFYNADHMHELLKAGAEGRADVENCLNLIKGSNIEDPNEAMEQLTSIEQCLNPSLTQDEAQDKIKSYFDD